MRARIPSLGAPVVAQPRAAPTTPATDVTRPRPALPSDAGFRRFEVGPSTVYPDTVLFFRSTWVAPLT